MKHLAVYQGARVLVTGDTGFKGSWLVLWLRHLGAEVVGLALPPPTPQTHYTVLGLSDSIRHYDADIRDYAQVSQLFSDFRPEFVFHLAAQALVSVGYADPRETFDTNVGGTTNILECVRQCASVRVFVNVTSDKTYKNKEWIWGYRECDELGGRDPYSASKSCADVIFSSYHESYFRTRAGLGVASVRAGNVIGGGDWAANRIIPDCVRAVTTGVPIVLRNPDATRPWQHVLEPLSGYLLLGARLRETPDRFSGAWNFGPDAGSTRTVQELAATFLKACNASEAMLRVDRSTAIGHEAGLLHLNCDKSFHLLGWRPHWDFAETVKQTASWYIDQGRGGAAASISLAQIEAYARARNNLD